MSRALKKMAASFSESDQPKTSPKQNRVVFVGCSGVVCEESVKALKAATKPTYPKIVLCSRDTDSECAKKYSDDEACEVVHGDFNDERSLKKPFKGASAVVLITPNSENRAELIQNGLNAAKSAGVPFVLVLSFILADSAHTVFGSQFNQIEMATKRSGLTYCIVRVPLFTDNLTEHFDCILKDGNISGAMSGSSMYTTINASDVGACIGSILDNVGKHHNVTHIVTGPTWCKDEAVTELSTALGQRITYEQKPLEEVQQCWRDKGMQEWQLRGMTEVWQMIDEGRFVFQDNEFKKIVGRNPKGLHDWVEDHKECIEKGEKKHSTICQSCDTAWGNAAASSSEAAKASAVGAAGLREDWTATSGSPGIATGKQ